MTAEQTERTETARCTHLDQIVEGVQPRTDGCEECLQSGDDWIALSICLTCGHVGCCYDSKGQHAWKHYEATGHPIIAAYKRKDNWRWCYPDDMYV
jgi:uncharacterized UBP type Zn finger protein